MSKCNFLMGGLIVAVSLWSVDLFANALCNKEQGDRSRIRKNIVVPLQVGVRQLSQTAQELRRIARVAHKIKRKYKYPKSIRKRARRLRNYANHASTDAVSFANNGQNLINQFQGIQNCLQAVRYAIRVGTYKKQLTNTVSFHQARLLAAYNSLKRKVDKYSLLNQKDTDWMHHLIPSAYAQIGSISESEFDEFVGDLFEFMIIFSLYQSVIELTEFIVEDDIQFSRFLLSQDIGNSELTQVLQELWQDASSELQEIRHQKQIEGQSSELSTDI